MNLALHWADCANLLASAHALNYPVSRLLSHIFFALTLVLSLSIATAAGNSDTIQTIQASQSISRHFVMALAVTALLLVAILAVYLRANAKLRREIAARTAIDESLQRSQVMMERTQSIAQLGSWEWDVAADVIVWSKELYRLAERDPACGTPDYAGQLALYSPQDGARLAAAVQVALSDGTPYTLEVMLNRKDGKHRVCLATGFAEKGGNGTVTRLFGSLQDITERKLVERHVELYRSVVQASLDGFWITNNQGRIVEVNQSTCQMLGYSAEELLSMGIYDIEADESAEETLAHTQEIMARGHVQFEARHRRKDGSIIDVEVSALHLPDLDDMFFAFVRDITARKVAEQQMRIAATVFESQEGMIVTSANNIILRVNQAFTDITGYSAEEAIGKRPSMLKSGRHDSDFYARLWEQLKGSGRWQGELWNRRKGGEPYPQWLTITVVKDKAGLVSHYVATMTDITQRKLAESEINALAFYDPLTGLPNRRLMLDRLRQALTGSDRSRRHGALMMMDLDNFKILNDTQGHDVGDQLLVEVSKRLQAGVREGDTVARLGGDEFVVILEGLDRAGFAAMQAEAVGVKIQALINEPYELTVSNQAGTCIHHCSVSIGITLFQDQHTPTDELMKRADTAMYQAKSAGRNTLRFFDPEMQAAVTSRAALESQLRSAISHQQLAVYYQPQVDGARQVVGVEALIRWMHPDRGVVLPGEFIPLAEDTGLILPLGDWILEAACQQLKTWALAPETAQLSIAVNVSARQFRQTEFVDRVLGLMDRWGTPAGRLKLELTESMLLDNTTEIIAKMGKIKARGVSFSLDDFGTGYSSLSYLKLLPIDQLKIDQSFVHDVLNDPNAATIACSIIALAHSLGLMVIAEGVETQEQSDFLARNGCDHCQGYLFGKPLALPEFEAQLYQR
jgi:diguanylate cyclase (GGDEF)-like protein/PAS domain S-box-containing protein